LIQKYENYTEWPKTREFNFWLPTSVQFFLTHSNTVSSKGYGATNGRRQQPGFSLLETHQNGLLILHGKTNCPHPTPST